MEKATFTIDDWLTVDGIHDPNAGSWNGWAVPYFGIKEVETISATTSKNIRPNDDYEIIVIDGDKVFSEYHGFDGEIDREEIPSVIVDGVTYYGVGAMSWVWTVVK